MFISYPARVQKAKKLDNTNSQDYAVCDSNNCILAEFYEHINHTSDGQGYVKSNAYGMAELFCSTINEHYLEWAANQKWEALEAEVDLELQSERK